VTHILHFSSSLRVRRVFPDSREVVCVRSDTTTHPKLEFLCGGIRRLEMPRTRQAPFGFWVAKLKAELLTVYRRGFQVAPGVLLWLAHDTFSLLAPPGSDFTSSCIQTR
jgi:hypothetical protein